MKNTSLAALGALTHCLQPAKPQHFTARLIQNDRQDLEKGQTLGYWTLRSTFVTKVFDYIIPFLVFFLVLAYQSHCMTYQDIRRQLTCQLFYFFLVFILSLGPAQQESLLCC